MHMPLYACMTMETPHPYTKSKLCNRYPKEMTLVKDSSPQGWISLVQVFGVEPFRSGH